MCIRDRDDVCIPDSYFLFYDNVIIFDLRNKKTYITALGIKEESEKSISKIYERIKKQDINLNISLDKNTEYTSNFSREEYINSVKKAMPRLCAAFIRLPSASEPSSTAVNAAASASTTQTVGAP